MGKENLILARNGVYSTIKKSEIMGLAREWA